MRLLVFGLLTMLGCSQQDKGPPPPASAPPTPARDASSDPTTEFWSWFAANAASLRADNDLRQTMERINTRLEKAGSGVVAEIGKEGENRKLVLTADGNKDLFPAVQDLYARRPKVDGWTIVAFRPRGDATVRIELGAQKLDLGKVKFVATRAGAKLDLDVFLPGFTTKEEMGQIAFLILDHVVGEYDMETKIGGIELASDQQAPKSARPISELPAAVDKLK